MELAWSVVQLLRRAIVRTHATVIVIAIAILLWFYGLLMIMCTLTNVPDNF